MGNSPFTSLIAGDAGMSGPYREDYGLSVEIDDLRALLNESQARPASAELRRRDRDGGGATDPRDRAPCRRTSPRLSSTTSCNGPGYLATNTRSRAAISPRRWPRRSKGPRIEA